MKHVCPYCGADLRFQLIKSTAVPGERKFLPNRVYSSCRKCAGVLILNQPSFENKYQIIMSFFCLPILFVQDIGNKSLRLGLLAVSIIGLACTAIYCSKHLRHWPRYRQANDEDLIQLGLAKLESRLD